jgi:phycocyanobilin:ferredoxin oxidoreductase
MMHCCIFPHTHNPAPIFGFDVIAGKNKITGCFYDFSPAGDSEHPLIDWFAGEAVKLQWNKTRKLPDWAERIFTECMIAAGNVSNEEELEQIFSMVKTGLTHYLEAVGETNNTAKQSTKSAQNYYCANQKQNPHTPRVMTSLGLNEEDVKVFIQDCLFPEIV